MRGFFSKSSTQLKSGEMKGASCAACGLYKHALSPKMEPYGHFAKQIMVIGEAPSEDEDRKGVPWQGKAGRMLKHKYRELGIDLVNDCISLNAVACHPTSKAPTAQEIACCRSKVVQAIHKYKPKLIILHGSVPTESLIGHKWHHNFDGIMKWRGWTIPDREYGAWVCPTFHPSFIERQEGDSEADVIWTQDLERALSKLGEPFPKFKNEEESIVITEDIEMVLGKMNTFGMMAFDIETTGLKPYAQGHRIVSISFCNNPDHAYAVPFPTKRKHLKMLRDLMENPKVGKVAANMKFEDTWLKVLHDIDVRPWLFDTMQAAHVLDNRPGITGLKFQAYVRQGIIGYDDDVAPYLKGEHPNAINRIMELVRTPEGLKKLLLYNGMDSLIEYRLARQQMKELRYMYA